MQVLLGSRKYNNPEVGMDMEEICKAILEGKRSGKLHNLILLAEGRWSRKMVAMKKRTETRATILGHIQRGSPTA